MNLDSIPTWGVFAATIVVVMMAVQVGHMLGHTVHRSAVDEKESSASAISAANLGLLAFMLAITFGMVTDRYQSRKALVREEANAIRSTYLRSDFLPQPYCGRSVALLRDYVDFRLAALESRDPDRMPIALADSIRIQRQLWDLAIVSARADASSRITLYVESLNDVIDDHALRVSVVLESRIPAGIWLVLYALVILGMLGVGYQTAIAGSARRSLATPVLAVSFSLVIVLIISIDRPMSTFIPISQQPLVDLQTWMARDIEARSSRGTDSVNSGDPTAGQNAEKAR